MNKPVEITPSPESQAKLGNSIQYTVNLINMSLQQLWQVAYTAGYEDAMKRNSQPEDASLQ